MLRKFLNLALGAVLTTAAMTPVVAHADTTDEPIITFRTSIYEHDGATNDFHIILGATETDYFDIDFGFGLEEVEVGVAYYDEDSEAMSGTYISGRVTSDGIVKIYGDASKLDYFEAEGCYIEWIDMEKCVNLQILDLQHNELQRLDLSPFTKLQAVYLTGNDYTEETPLVIGSNHPDLMILEVDITQYIDQSFDISDYPSLISFDGYYCRSLKKIDPTGCPNLQVLSVEMTDVESVDVSKNPNLLRLNISDTRVRNIDLSNNPYLQHLLAEHTAAEINKDVKLESLDVTNNPNLVLLRVNGNDFTEIDLTNNTYLTTLSLKHNKLTELDLSNNTNLYYVNIAHNDLDFSNLPLPQDTWGEYYYYRDALPCNRSYALGSPIDLSSRVLRDGTETTVVVWSDPVDGAAVEVDESYYTYENGIVTFNQIPTDSVYIEYANSAFADYTISSAKFKVKDPSEYGTPSKVLSLRTLMWNGKEATFGVSMAGANADDPSTIYVSDGENTATAYDVTSSDYNNPTYITITVPSNNTVVLSVPENDILTSFELTNTALRSIDLSAATELQALTINNCVLSSIDLVNNRCLKKLDLANNNLYSLSLAANYGDYQKTQLTDINASNNKISSFSIVHTYQLKNLDLSNNRLTSISLRDYDNIEHFNVANNNLSGTISFSYFENAKTIDISNNEIDSITMIDMPLLESFNVSNNKMTIGTLPLLSDASVKYTYAPQLDYELTAKAPAVNISDQYRMIDGNGTVFTWKKADGTELVNGVDINCENGATRFLDESLGLIYCEMAHAAFPDFAGENIYKTTQIEVVGAPTTVVASFTTSEASNAASLVLKGKSTSALFIDWRGDGSEYLQYPYVSDSYTLYEGITTYKDADVKVYTYDSADDVVIFSISDAAMSKMDASPLTSVTTFTVSNAWLDEASMVLPESPGLLELNLSGNRFSTEKFSQYPNLVALTLNVNDYKSFDVSGRESLQILAMNENYLTDIKFGNNKSLWGVALNDNQFSSIDFDGAIALDQVMLSGNQFRSIDLSPIASFVKVLELSNNYFTFETLPLASSLPSLTTYYFTNQAPVEVSCVEGKVDLSAQAKVEDTETVYRWFIGDVTIDSDTGEVSGEELDGESEDPEYSIVNGVTTFFYTFDERIICLMTNDVYENLNLFTSTVWVDKANGVESVLTDANISPDTPVDVYTISGQLVRKSVRFDQATEGLATGFYLVNGHKCYVRN